MIKLKVKKGSTVQVVTGSDKGKKGTVLDVQPLKMKVKVQGVRMQTHYSKEGLETKEGFLDYSNVKLISEAKKEAKKTSKKTSSKSK